MSSTTSSRTILNDATFNFGQIYESARLFYSTTSIHLSSIHFLIFDSEKLLISTIFPAVIFCGSDTLPYLKPLRILAYMPFLPPILIAYLS